ncbi:hypothetical protein GQ607_007373 [Colletotrichum asianum]|uniref:Uncharacterized protein n=1 Tax=Colletotrichum asianum TaxID=702518 RepID=A0A8H3WE53_9PEZI|nr:hypothetical protein GQ607_007373 [Colletotrichum asianum]
MGAGEESPEESKSRSGCAYARPGARCWARRRSNELAFPNSMGGDWMRGTRVESAAERRKNTVSRPLGYVSEFSQKVPQIRVTSYTNHFQAIHLFSPDPAPSPPITGLAPLRDLQHLIGGKA